MVFLQAGVPRSGNLWIYRTIRKMFEVTETPFNSYVMKYRDFITQSSVHDINQTYNHDVVQFLEDGIFWDPSHKSTLHIHDFSAYLAENSHLWTHSHFIESHLEEYKKLDRIIYIIRDPRDVLISNSKYLYIDKMQTYRPNPHGKTPEEYLENRHFALVHNWSKHISGYLKQSESLPIHFVFYERLLADFNQELDRLAAFLGFSMTDDQKEDVKHEVSFDTMHAQKPEHARKGQVGQWKNVLTEEQLQNILYVSEPYLKFLHYPTEIDLNNEASLPYLDIETITPESIAESEREINSHRARLNKLEKSRKNETLEKNDSGVLKWIKK